MVNISEKRKRLMELIEERDALSIEAFENKMKFNARDLEIKQRMWEITSEMGILVDSPNEEDQNERI